MNPRSLTLINSLGCLVLAGVVFSQWAKESRADGEMARLRSELGAAHDRIATEVRRVQDLERDITVLRQSFEDTRIAAAIARHRQGAEGARGQLEQARTQLGEWRKSLDERDRRITELERDLLATRRRLDEAVVRLQNSGR